MTKPIKPGEYYCTTFCNFAHLLKTGRPIGHECYVLPPAMLACEINGDIDGALEILRAKGKGPIVRGRSRQFESPEQEG